MNLEFNNEFYLDQGTVPQGRVAVLTGCILSGMRGHGSLFVRHCRHETAA
jgi:hypothetical protein